jgi:uncharacterized lipoprotein YmbA
MSGGHWLCLAALGVTVAACASPREHLYSLTSEGDERGELRQAGLVPTIVLGPVSLPEVIDRPQLVVRDSDFTVTINEQERWAAPLKEQLLRVLAADLDAHMTDRRVAPASSAAINSPVARLAIEISRLELSNVDGVILVTHWVYHPLLPQTPSREGDASAKFPLRQVGYPGFIDALNRACMAVSDQIGQQLAHAATPAG